MCAFNIIQVKNIDMVITMHWRRKKEVSSFFLIIHFVFVMSSASINQSIVAAAISSSKKKRCRVYLFLYEEYKKDKAKIAMRNSQIVKEHHCWDKKGRKNKMNIYFHFQFLTSPFIICMWLFIKWNASIHFEKNASENWPHEKKIIWYFYVITWYKKSNMDIRYELYVQILWKICEFLFPCWC